MSVRALALDAALRRVFARGAGPVDATVEIDRRRTAGTPDAAPVPRAVHKRFRVDTATVECSRVVTLTHRLGPRSGALIYVPGGGYAQPISAQHWTSIARFARAADVDALVPLYAVVPDGTAASAHRLVAAVLTDTLARYGAGHVILAGDSAGGGLALSALQRRPDGVRAAVLLNPWLDVEIGHPASSEIERWDVILRAAELRDWGRAWAADVPTADPSVSPLNGSVAGLPPVHIITGGRDLLMPDALHLHRRLAAAGNTGTLTYSPDGNHAVGLLGIATPEGRRAQDAIIRAIRA